MTVLFLLLVLNTFHQLFSCLVEERLQKRLRRSGHNGHCCLISDLKERCLNNSPLTKMVLTLFFVYVLYNIKDTTLYTQFSLSFYQMELIKCFFASIERIICFIHFKRFSLLLMWWNTLLFVCVCFFLLLRLG